MKINLLAAVSILSLTAFSSTSANEKLPDGTMPAQDFDFTDVQAVFANANAGGIVSVAAAPAPADLDAAAFALLTWVEVKQVGNHGETGSSTNILTYDTWGTDVIQKAKGMTDAGSPEIEVARLVTDAGQVILRAAALTNFNYAVKLEKNDMPSGGSTNTIIYNRGIITGPTRPNGRNEDFDLEVFTLGLNQREVIVDAT